jgi:hypothetical protein
MSDAAPGSISLEENALEIETPPPPVTPETPPPAVQNADDGEPEGTIVNPGGEKLVPLGALAGTREKLRAEKEAREKVEAEVATLREQTKEIEQIRTAWQAAQPVIQQARQAQQPPPKPAGPLSEQEAIEYAKDLDLYKLDGTPDTARAQRLASRQEALAARAAQQHVQPLQQQNAQTQSAANFQAVAAWKDATGAVVDSAILREIWATMPPEMTAQPNIAAVMYRVAVGETVLRGKHKPAVQPPPPVLETASLSGGTPARQELSSQERGFIEAVGMKPKDYEETSARYKPGERNSLE